MMYLSVLPTSLSVDFKEVESASGNLTAEPPIARTEGFRKLLCAKLRFSVPMPNQPFKSFPFKSNEFLRDGNDGGRWRNAQKARGAND
jgi:hypothetical protein